MSLAAGGNGGIRSHHFLRHGHAYFLQTEEIGLGIGKASKLVGRKKGGGLLIDKLVDLVLDLHGLIHLGG